MHTFSLISLYFKEFIVGMFSSIIQFKRFNTVVITLWQSFPNLRVDQTSWQACWITPRYFESVGKRWGLRICINKQPLVILMPLAWKPHLELLLCSLLLLLWRIDIDPDWCTGIPLILSWLSNILLHGWVYLDLFKNSVVDGYIYLGNFQVFRIWRILQWIFISMYARYWCLSSWGIESLM